MWQIRKEKKLRCVIQRPPEWPFPLFVIFRETMCNGSRMSMSPSLSTTAISCLPMAINSGCGMEYSRPSEVRNTKGRNPPDKRRRILSTFMTDRYGGLDCSSIWIARRQPQRCIQLRNFLQFFRIRATAQFLNPFARRPNSRFITAHCLIESLVGGFQAIANVAKIFAESDHPLIKLLRSLGDFLHILRLRVLLPTDAHRAQQRDQRCRRRQHDAFFGGPNNQFMIAFQCRAEKRLGWQEQNDMVQCVRKFTRIIPRGQGRDRHL